MILNFVFQIPDTKIALSCSKIKNMEKTCGSASYPYTDIRRPHGAGRRPASKERVYPCQHNALHLLQLLPPPKHMQVYEKASKYPNFRLIMELLFFIRFH